MCTVATPPTLYMLELAKVLLSVKVHIPAISTNFQARAQILTSAISIVLYTRKKKQAFACVCIHVHAYICHPQKSPPPQYQTSSYPTF